MSEQRSPINLPSDLSELPQPGSDSRIHSELLCTHIRQEVERAGGRLPFDRFMELCLYAPGLGYYVAGSRKFGEGGDFVTAPEVSSIFARCLARQCAQVLGQVAAGDLLEFGAGTGVMAADVLVELELLGALPERYLILELSPDLRLRQQETLEDRAPHLQHKVQWLETMPTPGFNGVILANEVMDAMPVQRFRIELGVVREQFVQKDGDGFTLTWDDPITPGLAAAVTELGLDLDDGYESELNMRAQHWICELGERVALGAVLLIDYGYPRAEYYHPQRCEGTLMCYYRHRAHPDPLLLPGLQDITAHVDFTAMAEAGLQAGFEIGGYSTQAHFLMGSGLEEILAASDPDEVESHMQLVQEIRRLTLPTGMGEQFKVLGLTKGLDQPLIGFGVRDQRERL
ncbi:MAG: SAM-dependent methyltransferase [Gammaproteobacteria bacterium]|nr:SAM-dependent methyltransferase [Gammaproteobacteria bacterium]